MAFAGCGDRLTFCAGPQLELVVSGPTAAQSGAVADNLVLRAANALAARIAGLALGRFTLTKRTAGGRRPRRRLGRCGGSAAAARNGE